MNRMVRNVNGFLVGFLAVCLLALCTNANAGGKKPPKAPPVPVMVDQEQKQLQKTDVTTGPVTVDVTTGPTDSTAISDATAKSAASASNEGNELSVEVAGDVYDIPVSTSYSPPAYTRVECGSVLGVGSTRDDGSVAVGVQTPRWLSRQLRDCQRRNDSEWLQVMGLTEDAVDARCMTRSLQEQYGTTDKCKSKLVAKLRTNNEQAERLAFLESERVRLLDEAKADKQRCNQAKSNIVKGCGLSK